MLLWLLLYFWLVYLTRGKAKRYSFSYFNGMTENILIWLLIMVITLFFHFQTWLHLLLFYLLSIIFQIIFCFRSFQKLKTHDCLFLKKFIVIITIVLYLYYLTIHYDNFLHKHWHNWKSDTINQNANIDKYWKISKQLLPLPIHYQCDNCHFYQRNLIHWILIANCL